MGLLLCTLLAACSATPPPGRSVTATASVPASSSPTTPPHCTVASAPPLAAVGPSSALRIDILVVGIANPDDLLWSGEQLYIGDVLAGRIRLVIAGRDLQTLPVSIPAVEGMTVFNSSLYAASQTGDRVVSVSGSPTTTVVQLSPVRGVDGVDGIASTSSGLIVPDSARGTVLLTNGNGQVVRTVSGFTRPTHALLTPDGSLMVADENAGEVVSVAPQGERTIIARGLNSVDDLALAADGALLAITEASPGRLVEIRGGQVTDIATALATPQGLALDDAGNILISEASAGRVDVLVRTLRALPLSGAVAPHSVACISIERAAGFAGDVQLTASPGVRVVQQPGPGSEAVVVVDGCAPTPCHISAHSGSLRSAVEVMTSG